MPDTFASGFPLFEQLSQPHGESDPVSLLAQFKGHVKKELVNVPSIPNYFTGLLYALDEPKFSDSARLLTLAHSSLCYLIKRVAMQSPSYFENSNTIRESVVHLFLLGGNKNKNIELEGRSFWVSSLRALEAMYLIQPVTLQECLRELLSDDENGQRRKTLLVIEEILQISQKLGGDQGKDAAYQSFLPSLLGILNWGQQDDAIAALVCDIVVKYETDKQKLTEVATRIEHADSRAIFENTAAIRTNTDRRGSRPCSESSQQPALLDVEGEFDALFEEFQILGSHHSSSSLVEASELREESLEYIQALLERLLTPFQNLKETEKNWKMRQANLVEMRGLVQNKFVLEHRIEFLSACRELQLMECVGRAAQSLRTTLSTAACLLIKDFLQIFPLNLDSVLLDQIFESLRALLFSSKKISSTNAFNCLVIMFTGIDFHNKLFQNCFVLINQKSTLPRTYSAILLRIFIIKFHHTSKLENSTIYIEEWLKKGITDAQTSVREAMRKTFWYYYKCYPNHAKKFLHSQLSLQLRKAVELSIPQHLNIDYQSAFPNSSISSASSSLSSSRRTSLGVSKKFPSYAQPTQSSSTFLQRMANARSASEYVLRESNLNASTSNSGRRKISAPPQLAKRSLTTPQPDSHHNNDHHTEMETRSSQEITEKSHESDAAPKVILHSEHLRNERTDNSLQIDLTGNLSYNHSSKTAVKKYTGHENGAKVNDDLETMYQYLESPSLVRVKDGLQMLQNKLLMRKNPAHNKDCESANLDFERLTPLIRNLMVKLPEELKPLLSIPEFCRSLPLKYLIEIYTINYLSFSDELLKTLPVDTILHTICEIFEYLDSSLSDQEKENSPSLSLHYMKYKQFIFNFCFALLQQILKMEAVDSAEVTDPLGQCITKLTHICGQEYDETLYYDTLYQIYLYNMPCFVEKLRQVAYVSTKLKICDELEARDKSQSFHREDIMSRQSLDGTEKAAESKVDLVDDRKFMEMTMVNPFNQMRIASGSSVVRHDPDTSDSAVHTRDASSPVQVGHDDFNPKKLSEITKVISIYQPVENTPLEDEKTITFGQNQNQDVEMSGVDQEMSVNLSEIFGNSQEHETTVKFSKEPPKIINPASRMPSSTGEVDVSKEEENNFANNVSLERDKSPVTPLTDHQSKELSNGINSIDIGKKHEQTVSHEARCSCNLSAEILANAMKEGESDWRMCEFELLEAVPSDSLIYHEISDAVIMTNEYKDFNQLFMQMRKAITRIESRSFTMRHLNCLIAPLIICLREENMRKWLEMENGYNELLHLSETLFHSADETQMLPVNLACKSIVLIECLVLSNSYLQNVVPISSADFKAIWKDMTVMVGKLPECTSEIYCLLQELRDLLVFLNFFAEEDITEMLHGLTSGVKSDDGMPGLKELFLMETLSMILSKTKIVFEKQQIIEIIEVMHLYLETKKTEWRCASCEVISQAIGHLDPKHKKVEELDELLPGLSSGRQHVIHALSSR